VDTQDVRTYILAFLRARRNSRTSDIVTYAMDHGATSTQVLNGLFLLVELGQVEHDRFGTDRWNLTPRGAAATAKQFPASPEQFPE
jgi:hypothetical protein